VRDEHTIEIPNDAPPGRYNLWAGLEDPISGRRLHVLGDSGVDAISLQSIRVIRKEPLTTKDIPNGMRATFGDRIEFLGYGLETDGGGSIIALTLYWRGGAPISEAHTVSVHLLGDDGHIAAQADGEPMNGLLPTDAWEVGEIVEDRHLVHLPPDLPPGEYTLAIGMYQAQTLERLELAAPEGQVSHNLLTLSSVVQLP
jgi:hypothetical protein